MGVDFADPDAPDGGYAVDYLTGEPINPNDDNAPDDDPSDDEPVKGSVTGGGYFPTCRFCGRRELPVADYHSQADADEVATLRCDCYESRQYRDELDRKKRRDDNIAKLRQRLDDFAEYVAKRRAELSGELYDFLVNVGINVLDYKMDAATVAFGRFKIKISVGNKSALSLSFSYADAAKTEV